MSLPFFQDRRRRNLAILTALAAMSLILAATALSWREHQTAPKYPQTLLLPNLAAHLHEVARIHVQTGHQGGYDVIFDTMKGWLLPGHDNYPAAFETVRQMLNGLANLRTIEPKTTRPDWYGRIKVDAPPQGSGTLIQLFDGSGKVMAALIAGSEEPAETASGGVRIFVRKPDQAQSWLASVPASLPLHQDQWLDHDILSLERTRIQSASYSFASAPGFTLQRAAPEAAFAMPGQQDGKAEPGQLEAAATALAGFAFDNVVPADQLDFSRGTHIALATFDGLQIAADIVQKDGASWARLNASGEGETAQEASAINAKAYGWAFKLTPDAAQALAVTRQSLLEPAK